MVIENHAHGETCVFAVVFISVCEEVAPVSVRRKDVFQQ